MKRRETKSKGEYLSGANDDNVRRPINFNNQQHKSFKDEPDHSDDMDWEKSHGVYKDPMGVWNDTTRESPQRSYNSAYDTPHGNMSGVGDTGANSRRPINFNNKQHAFNNEAQDNTDDMTWEKEHGVFHNPTGHFKDKDTGHMHEVDLRQHVKVVGMPDESINGNSSDDCPGMGGSGKGNGYGW